MKRNIVLVVGAGLLSLLLFWAPFLFKSETFGGIEFGGIGMETIVANFDGLNFLVVAKSGYDPEIIKQINTQFLTGNEPVYFSAHYPLMPLLVRFLAVVVPLPTALLLVVILSNAVLGAALYYFFAELLKKKKLAVILTFIALFFPARMLPVRGVGSNEPLFIALILSSLIAGFKNRHWEAAVLGSLAVLTRSPGILLFGVYLLSLWRNPRALAPYLLMPVTLLGLFAFYGAAYGSPLAYFQSGDNLHLFLTPFQIFSNTQSWIDGIWREDIIYLYLFYGIGVSLVGSKWRQVKKFGYLYGAVLLLVAHRDLARYALPLAPIALLGYAPLVEKAKQYWWVLLLLLFPIYLYGWQFVLGNVQPINDWGVF